MPGRLHGPNRVTVNTYRNSHDQERVAVYMHRELALKIAVGDREAIERVHDAIAERIEKEEADGE